MDVNEHSGGVAFGVRVQPRASRDAIEGEHQGALKVRVTAPPVDDRANEAVRRLLAEALGVPVRAVQITGGEKSRNKRVRVEGVTADRINSLLKPQMNTDKH